jgi:hypothetical protein
VFSGGKSVSKCPAHGFEFLVSRRIQHFVSDGVDDAEIVARRPNGFKAGSYFHRKA